ncbi:M14 metallopeptidase family protein [Maribacter sp. HTCC2170]|uniref:M14 family metallopeptidase n=1 Tax=Maribacter sp. (strain HTCC2170 / KCCM 42371) TaxID=313603 RepID=UPI00006AFD9A|nr:M14 metallopeptidase family protein [Maribacter sp. HTCC2170]EAR01203.1 hypothetical protein FB2170_10801 [Maribacter sp. HTCC2170]
MDFPQKDYHLIKQNALHGRYITRGHISSILDGLSEKFVVENIGQSVNRLPIESVTFGKGSKKILMWSQMHGNESTTTKAVFDFFNFMDSGVELSNSILKNCTIKIIPILNPDGAKAYTRVNANGVDLNRDARIRSQPESNVLRECFESFEPNYCFNLHDQRTIFNVMGTTKPATVSFLAPSFNKERGISKSRATSMHLIVAMNKRLQKMIPGQVGRYDDSFNENCIGDTFQMLDVPTVLFEAGHYPEDYMRENTREYIFQALVVAMGTIVGNKIGDYAKKEYFDIPENAKLFYDVLIQNAHLINSEKYRANDIVAILFKEVLEGNNICFKPEIKKVGSLLDFYGHQKYDCSKMEDLELIKKQSFWEVL